MLSQEKRFEYHLRNKNPKHKLIISLAYDAGLRINEVVSLEIKDVNLEELIIHLKNAKGNKDRVTIFSKKKLKSIFKT